MLDKTSKVMLALAIVGFASIQAQSNMLGVDIQPGGEVAVKPGQNFTIRCSVNQVPLQVCRFQVPGMGSMVLTEDQVSDDGIEYAGMGLAKGDCGIFFRQVRESHDGNVTCSLTPRQGRTESHNTMRLIVARAPQYPRLHIRGGREGADIFRPNDQMSAGCVVEGGRPPANVSIFLDEEPLTPPDIYPVNREFSRENRVVKNISRIIETSDNGKILRCVSSHIAQDRPIEETRMINVHFAPVEQPIINSFGHMIGKSGQINVTVEANPRPTFTWNIDGELILAGQQGHATDDSLRLQSNTPFEKANGKWELIMTIADMKLEDTKKSYKLIAENKYGLVTYDINLSTDMQPEGMPLDAGSIISIVIGVLLLILVIFVAVFARATGRWCFAAKHRYDEEAVGGAGAGSEAHITPGDEDDETSRHIIDEKSGKDQGQENPVHASSEYVNGRSDHHQNNKDKKIDTPV